MYSYFKSLASFIGRENALTAYDAGKTYSVYSPYILCNDVLLNIAFILNIFNFYSLLYLTNDQL
jgi:hypothetical protein